MMRMAWPIIALLLLLLVSSGEMARQLSSRLAPSPKFAVTETSLEVQQGHHAFFHCRVQKLTNNTISWIRKRDSHMLFIGNQRFLQDDRYELVHHSYTNSNEFLSTLKLRFVSSEDHGDQFECQVSTVPKISLVFDLSVVVPRVSISGAVEKHVLPGSSVELRCVVTNALASPSFFFWYHNDTRIINDAPSLYLVRDTSVDRSGREAHSVLTLPKCTARHAGRYECRPEHLEPAAISLHLVHDERTAAMQHGQEATAPPASAAKASAASSEAADLAASTFLTALFTLKTLIGLV